MQRLSMIALAAIAVLALSGAGFTSKPASPSTPTSNPNPAAAQTPTPISPGPGTAFASLYWYSTINDAWVDYQTLDNEIYEMEMYWGCVVNEDQVNGVLLEEGFTVQNYNYPVMIWLYGHFD